jgi:hypothetical protein
MVLNWLLKKQVQEGEGYRTNWQWSRHDLPTDMGIFNVVFDRYQFKFNYPEKG